MVDLPGREPRRRARRVHEVPVWAGDQCAIEALGCGRPTADRAGFTAGPARAPACPRARTRPRPRRARAAAPAAARARDAGADEPVRHSAAIRGRRRAGRARISCARRSSRRRACRAPARARALGRGEANERARSWLGAPSELEAVLGGSSGGAARCIWCLLSPKFEHIPGKGDRDYVSRESAHRRARARARARRDGSILSRPPARRPQSRVKYEREHETLTRSGMVIVGGSLDFWACLGRPQGGATSGTARSGATLFVASDTQGVCPAAARARGRTRRRREDRRLDSPPMHLSRDTREKKRGTHDQAYCWSGRLGGRAPSAPQRRARLVPYFARPGHYLRLAPPQVAIVQRYGEGHIPPPRRRLCQAGRARSRGLGTGRRRRALSRQMRAGQRRANRPGIDGRGTRLVALIGP